MALYLISYDIAEKNNDYQSLYDLLGQWGAVRVLYSEWVAKLNGTALDVTNEIIKHIEAGDGVLVTEMTTNTAWQNLKITTEAMQALFC